jgi:hypothetical protein
MVWCRINLKFLYKYDNVGLADFKLFLHLLFPIEEILHVVFICQILNLFTSAGNEDVSYFHSLIIQIRNEVSLRHTFIMFFPWRSEWAMLTSVNIYVFRSCTLCTDCCAFCCYSQVRCLLTKKYLGLMIISVYRLAELLVSTLVCLS